MLYILHEDKNNFFDINGDGIFTSAKKLNRKKIRVKEIFDIEEVPEIFDDPNAVLFIPIELNEQHSKTICLCNSNNVPVITANNYIDTNKRYDYYFSPIIDDMSYTIKMILSYCRQHKKHRIAFFGAALGSTCDKEKILALYDTCSEFNKSDAYFNNNNSIGKCFEEFYQHRYEYDAVICSHDYTAMAFMELMQKTDIEYLKDRFIIGFSDTILSKIYSPAITTVNYYTEDIVRALHSLYLLLRKKGDNILTLSATIKNRINIRSTTGNLSFNGDNTFYSANLKKEKMVFPKQSVETNFEKDPSIGKFQQMDGALRFFDITDFMIMHLMLKGLKNQEISSRLYISEQTIKSHQRKMFKKSKVGGKREFLNLFSPYIDINNLEKYISEHNNNEF